MGQAIGSGSVDSADSADSTNNHTFTISEIYRENNSGHWHPSKKKLKLLLLGTVLFFHSIR